MCLEGYTGALPVAKMCYLSGFRFFVTACDGLRLPGATLCNIITLLSILRSSWITQQLIVLLIAHDGRNRFEEDEDEPMNNGGR